MSCSGAKASNVGQQAFLKDGVSESLALSEHRALSSLARTFWVASTDLVGVVSEAAELLRGASSLTHEIVSRTIYCPFLSGFECCYCPGVAPGHSQFCALSLKFTFSLGSPPAALDSNLKPPGSFCYNWSA